MLTLMTMANWNAQAIDVKGAFLKGRFLDDESLHLRIPEGFEDKSEKDVVLHLQRNIYGLKQAVIAFWKELITAFCVMGFKRSDSDPCLHFKNAYNGLVIWISWVDDCLLVGHRDKVK
jgi:Reverse transcriptase (RNA-dependent DNA polymerase)